MTDKKLALLAIAAVIMAGWAILQNRLAQQAGSRDLFQRSPLIQGLDPAAIDAVTMTSEKGEKTLTLKKANGRFTVADKDGYPANVSAINTLLNNCLDIRTTERVTSNPSNHAELGVTDQTARYGVRFLNAEGKEIIGVLISETQSDRQGAFARLTTSDEVYFIQSAPWLSTGVMEYIDGVILEADRSTIRQVAVKGPNGDYVLNGADDGVTVTLDAMPVGKRFKGTAYRSVFGALGSFRFEDVMAVENTPEGLVYDRSFICRMEDTTVYAVMLATKDEKTYATVSAEFLDKTPVQVGRTESEEELKKKEAKLLAMDAVKAFNDRHKGWVYQIASTKADDFYKPMVDLLEDIPVPESPNEPTAAADPNHV
jgi:hypothetical protein